MLFGVTMSREACKLDSTSIQPTGSPHIHNHEVTEDEVMEVLEKPGEDRPGFSKTSMTSSSVTS
jgi:hypothetical protein